MYNILIDELPERWCGVKIKSSYRNVIKFFEITKKIKNESDLKYEIAFKIIDLFFESTPVLQDEIFDFIIWFINRGKETKDDDNEKVFDFFTDSGRIYSAFLQAYNIDLQKSDLHWWVFMELLENLPQHTRFMEVIDIRTKKEEKNDSKEYKLQLRKLKRIFAIDSEERNDKKETQGWVSFFR
jgi:hypothetical protein